jgi:hypothetical protein
VQKFTRPLTREIEIGGERLALTFSEKGIVVRPVGSRRPPWEMSWATLVCHVGAHEGHEPPPEQVSAALHRIKSGAPAKAGGSQSETSSHAAAPAATAPSTQ